MKARSLNVSSSVSAQTNEAGAGAVMFTGSLFFPVSPFGEGEDQAEPEGEGRPLRERTTTKGAWRSGQTGGERRRQ